MVNNIGRNSESQSFEQFFKDHGSRAQKVLSNMKNKAEKNVFAKYYAFDSGWKAVVCETLEIPSHYCLRAYNRLNVIRFVAFTILLLPAVIGRGLSEVIYLVSAERIKKEDYLSEIDNWGKLTWCVETSSDSSKFIDYCIRHRIQAKTNNHNINMLTNLERDGWNNNLFESDGQLHWCQDLESDVINQINPLVIIAPVTNKDEEKWFDGKYSKKLSRSNFISSQSLKDIFWRASYEENPKNLVKNSHFLWLPQHLPRTRKYAHYVRSMIENRIDDELPNTTSKPLTKLENLFRFFNHIL